MIYRMASEREAIVAQIQFEQHLRSLGAHSVVVARLGRRARKTFGLIALFQTPPRNTPRTVDVVVADKKVAIPVVAIVTERDTPDEAEWCASRG
jgi:hypothetical protein